MEENELTDDSWEDQEGDDDNIIDWATLDDSAPSAEEYSSQSDDESDKLDPNNTIRYFFYLESLITGINRSIFNFSNLQCFQLCLDCLPEI